MNKLRFDKGETKMIYQIKYDYEERSIHAFFLCSVWNIISFEERDIKESDY